MKTTRKILSILLVLAMVSALFVVGATAEGEGTVTPVQVPLIDESGNLEGSKIAPDGKPETATDIAYLSDTTHVAVTANATVKNNQPYHGNTFPYVAPNKDSRKQVDNKAYPKKNLDGTDVTDPATGAVVNHEESGAREWPVNGEIVTYYYNKIHLGGYGTTYEKGISTHPNALGSDDRSIIYATNGAEYFYSIVGGSGSNITDPKDNNLTAWADFEVYGSTAEEYTEDAEFVLLASATKIGDWYTAEFNVDVSEYNYIKLLIRMNEENQINKSGTVSNSSCGVTWADACVYNLPDYTVTYNGNGGKTEDDKESVTVELTNVTEAVTAAANTFAYVEAEGSTVTHIFNGWNTKADGTGTAVAADADITALADENGAITLYAQWKEVAKAHTVTFVVDGETHSTALVEDGADATLPTIEVEEGYTLVWDKDGKNITADTTITGTTTINKYTVTFVVPGQENTTATVEHGADAALPAIPEKSGFTGVWDHDGKAITADTTITASYVRTVVSVKPGNKISGLKGASNKTWLSDLYGKDVADAATHTLVENPKYVVYSYVQQNTNFPNGRLFSVNVNFFNRAGIYSNNGEKYDYITKGTLDANGKTYKNTDIVLGVNGTLFEKGLGFQPANKGSKTPSSVVFDVSSLKGDHFYAVVGLTGLASNNEQMVASDAKKTPADLTFKVYGSKAETYSETAEFELLASCENLTEAQVGEFNVNIEGYKYLKLVCENNTASHNNEAVWANACVFTADVSADTADGFSMTAVAAAIVAATSVVALVVTRKKFF